MIRKQHDLLITNVPGPQVALYAAGAQLVTSYPFLPLSAGHVLAIGVTSYDGEIFVGLTSDRDAISDLDVLAQCLLDSLDELLDTTVRATNVRQPTRKATASARRSAEMKAAARQEAARKAAGLKRAAVRNLVSRAAELGRGANLPPASATAVNSDEPSESAPEKPNTAQTPPMSKPVAERASSHNGYDYSREDLNWASDAGIGPLGDLAELLDDRPAGGWGPETHLLLVSGGSHAGNVAGHRDRDRFTPGHRVHLIPLEPIAAHEHAVFAIVPPWLKKVWLDPEAEGTD